MLLASFWNPVDLKERSIEYSYQQRVPSPTFTLPPMQGERFDSTQPLPEFQGHFFSFTSHPSLKRDGFVSHRRYFSSIYNDHSKSFPQHSFLEIEPASYKRLGEEKKDESHQRQRLQRSPSFC